MADDLPVSGVPVTAGLVVPDVSSWNPGLTHHFQRDFLIFRVCDGANYQDPKFLPNANVIHDLYVSGHIAGAIGYQVYRPVSPALMFNFYWHLMGPTPPPWLKGVMVDMENWGGQIRGDQSVGANALCGMHAQKMRSWYATLGYGNRYDLAGLWPRRDKRVRVIVASYGPDLVTKLVPGAIGQQYTDGSTRYGVPSGLPRSSYDFGNVDHNVFPGVASGKQLAALLTPPPAPQPAPKPVPKPPAPKPPVLYPAGPDSLVANGREYKVELGLSGHLRLFHAGVEVGEFQLVKSGPGTPNLPK